MENNFEIITDENNFYSKGFKNILKYELILNNQGITLEDCFLLFEYIFNYTQNSQNKIQPSETMSYYSWLIFFKHCNGCLEIYELDPNTNEFIAGIKTSTYLLKSQLEICRIYEVIPKFVNFGNLVAVSKGVLHSDKIECIRYANEGNNSGWFIVSNEYNGDYKSMEVIHFSHFALKHFDVIKYFALPEGFVILKNRQEIIVEFDMDILEE